MKKFDTLKWIRTVRDHDHQAQQGLSDAEKLAKTKREAQAFQNARAGQNVSARKRNANG